MEAENRGSEERGSGFRWLILSTIFATYSLIVLGGVVRATDSGDACPDWPRCQGELIPPFDTAVLIEFSHRLLASVVGFLILAVLIVAWRTYRHNHAIVWGSALALVMVIAQAILGGVTVLNELPANLVMAHLALASALLALLMGLAFVSWGSRLPAVRRSAESASFRNLALFAAIATFGLMLTGSYVAGSGAGLAFRDWPLFDGQVVPDGGRLAMIHAMHRFVAAGIGLLIGYVALRAWQTQRHDRVLVTVSLAAFALVLLQALVGAANIWTLLEPAARAAHLALAVALWAIMVGVTLFAHRAMLAHRAAEGSVTRSGKPERPLAMREPAQHSMPAQGS